ncbi:MAG TPA: DUF1800 domain-containing protein [Polyangiaceae bacterium LLY-WYZ-15_(1-7)]|nr:hypothetical protein [Sandaracinus sp.]HJL04831.1 DUF1800 domain-containing protein [Polyangiaceae bacterium LLY-WYZ-15_(1-7)]MBJ72482.1 hypothetical protein [Sandaracinus sp.]HJL09926.1 DUF1800 domain-containing protein [Polyangiaceae bacterium LLY-WYZ-15_(1-7)]HJL24605.1 DUF1800 domain-containing protein [Polyangiaceae bacterium LLY-WYZ-15_(1-7)]
MRRRDCLLLGAQAGALAGCGRAARLLEPDPPPLLDAPASRSLGRLLLDRAAFGPRPGDVPRVDADPGAWLEAQLHPERLDDAACALRLAGLDAWHLPTELTAELRPVHLERQLAAHAVLRATYSRRQLQEVLATTWADHFHVSTGKDGCPGLLPAHLRDAIRPHVLGRFADLLRAATLSPAMLVYLDGRANTADAPNENHARELLELHALGVDGGYTQRDVMELARALTGWTVRAPRERRGPGAVGALRFDPARHDGGPKTLLGRRLPAGGGRRDLDRALGILVAHPSCARHVARRLVRALAGAPAPPALLEAATRAFRASGGDLRRTTRAVLAHPGLVDTRGAVLARPFRFVVSALRATGAATRADGDVLLHLEAMGQRPHRHPTPDGYPLEARPWLGSLSARWRFAHALAHGRLDDTDPVALGPLPALPDADARHLLGRAPTAAERAAFAPLAPADRLAAILSSPAYQTS